MNSAFTFTLAVPQFRNFLGKTKLCVFETQEGNRERVLMSRLILHKYDFELSAILEGVGTSRVRRPLEPAYAMTSGGDAPSAELFVNSDGCSVRVSR